MYMKTETKLLKTAEAAEYLGFKVSYLHKLMMRKVIPYYKPNGKQCYFDKQDLDNFLFGVRISSESEAEEVAARYISNHFKH